MNLTELKQKSAADLVSLAEDMGIENMARARKQDIIFSILKTHAKGGEDIFGSGVLEILPDGFGFLRSADASYLGSQDYSRTLYMFGYGKKIFSWMSVGVTAKIENIKNKIMGA